LFSHQGIRSMQDRGPKKPAPRKRKKPVHRKKQLKRPRDNDHLADILETYEDK
jgi:transcription initiation factor TFIIE subunit beta